MTTVLSNHPFLDGPRKYVNVVFRDYLYAHALRRIEPSEGIIRCVRRKLRSPDYLASPLLAAFLHAQTEERQTGDVAGEDVAAVVESARARSPEEDAGFALFAGGSRETGVLLVDMGGGRQLAFRVSDVRHATLPGKTANAFVVSGGVVELLSRNGSIVIGPNAFIWAEDGVILDAADVMLVTGDQGSVVIDTSEIMGPPEQAVRKVGSGQVLVVWEGAHYPWIEHSGERPSFDSPVDAYETYVELRRIVTRFKGGSAGTSPCILRDFLDQFVLKDNTRAQAVFDVLVEMQVITKDHKFFYLDLGALEHAGINYVDLRANRVGDGLRKFVNEILKRRA